MRLLHITWKIIKEPIHNSCHFFFIFCRIGHFIPQLDTHFFLKIHAQKNGIRITRHRIQIIVQMRRQKCRIKITYRQSKIFRVNCHQRSFCFIVTHFFAKWCRNLILTVNFRCMFYTFHALIGRKIRLRIGYFLIRIIRKERLITLPLLFENKCCSRFIPDITLRIGKNRPRHRCVKNTKCNRQHQKDHHKALFSLCSQNL